MEPVDQKSPSGKEVQHPVRGRARGRFRIIEGNDMPCEQADDIPRNSQGSKQPLQELEENKNILRQKGWEPGTTMPHGAWLTSPRRMNDPLSEHPFLKTPGKSMSPAVLRLLLEEARLDEDAYAERRLSRPSQSRPRRRSPSVAPGNQRSVRKAGNGSGQLSPQFRESLMARRDQRMPIENSSQSADVRTKRDQMQMK